MCVADVGRDVGEYLGDGARLRLIRVAGGREGGCDGAEQCARGVAAAGARVVALQHHDGGPLRGRVGSRGRQSPVAVRPRRRLHDRWCEVHLAHEHRARVSGRQPVGGVAQRVEPADGAVADGRVRACGGEADADLGGWRGEARLRSLAGAHARALTLGPGAVQVDVLLQPRVAGGDDDAQLVRVHIRAVAQRQPRGCQQQARLEADGPQPLARQHSGHRRVLQVRGGHGGGSDDRGRHGAPNTTHSMFPPKPNALLMATETGVARASPETTSTSHAGSRVS